jgi:predicted nucleic acid-binding protein
LRDHATTVLAGARDGVFRAVTGDAAVAEVMAGPYRTGDQMLIRSVREFFAQPRLVEVVSHDARAFDDAAMLRGSLGLPFIDALHLATAAAQGCSAIITHDARLKPALGVEVVALTSPVRD